MQYLLSISLILIATLASIEPVQGIYKGLIDRDYGWARFSLITVIVIWTAVIIGVYAFSIIFSPQ